MDWVEWSLITVFSLMLIVECIALARRDRPITGAARTDGRMWLIWPWGWGMLPGHFWSPWKSIRYGWILLIAIGLAVLWRDFWMRARGKRYGRLAPGIALLFGLVCGTVLWSSGY